MDGKEEEGEEVERRKKTMRWKTINKYTNFIIKTFSN